MALGRLEFCRTVTWAHFHRNALAERPSEKRHRATPASVASPLACACAYRYVVPYFRCASVPVHLVLPPWTWEPGRGRARPIRRTPGAPHIPSASTRLAVPLPPVLEACPHDSLNIFLKHETLATWDNWIQHTFEADKTFGTYTFNLCVKRMQHKAKTLTTWKHLLQHKT
jgi:hypothetical protein